MGKLVEMPNGDLVEVPDNIAPEALEKIKGNYAQQDAPRARLSGNTVDFDPAAPQPKTRAERKAAGVPRKSSETQQQRVNRLAQGRVDDMGDDSYTMFDKAVDGYTFGMGNRLSSAIAAPINGARRALKGDNFFSATGEEYDIGREVREKQEARYDNRTGFEGDAAELVGAVANPLGAGGKIVSAGARGIKAAANALNSARLGKAANTTARAGMKIRNAGPVASSIGAGALGGGLNQAGQGEFEDVGTNLVQGAALGAAAGGLMGTGVNAVRKAAQTIGDKGVKATNREAQRKVADMLDVANVSPAKSAAEIASAKSANNDMVLADMAPSLGREASNISIRPNVPRSNNMIENARFRIDDRRTRFAQEVDNNANLPNNRATQQADSIDARRKAAGERDYAKGGAMDQPLVMDKENLKIFGRMTSGNPDYKRALNEATREMKEDGFNIGQQLKDGEVFPSMRVFNSLKQKLEGVAGEYAAKGNNAQAARVGKQIREIRNMLADQNPKYKDILMAQRTEYEKKAGLEWGQKVIGGLTGQAALNPRTLVRELRDLPADAQLDARVGIIDKLMLKESVGDPVAFVDKVNRSPEQRKLLEFAFGGKEQYDTFFKWVAREAKSKETDRLIAPGYTSDTGAKIAGAAESASEGVGNVASAGFKGMGFGGLVGGVANASATLRGLEKWTTRPQYNEIARILMGDAKGLADDLKAMATFYAKRDARNKTAAVKSAKGAQQQFTTQMGNE